MTKMTKIQRFATAYSNYREIEDMNDLKKNKLTLAEYNAVYDVLASMSDCKTDGETIMADVAEWFKRNNFVVTSKGIGWKISL